MTGWRVVLLVSVCATGAQAQPGAAGRLPRVPFPIVPPPTAGDVSEATRAVAGSAVVRTLASIGTDRLSVRDCGAAMDGTTDDGAAFQTCVNLMSPGQVLYVPPGGFDISFAPRVTNGPIGFDLSENGYGGGTVPVIDVTNDLPVRGMLGSGWYFDRVTDNGPYSSNDATVRIDGVEGATSDPGGVGNQSTLQTNCHVPPPAASGSYGKYFTWCNETVMVDSHIGPAQNVALTGSYFKPYTALLDGFGPRGPGWALYWEANDQTGENSSVSGSVVGAEGDLYAGGYDANGRINLHLGLGRSAPWMTAEEVGAMLDLSVGSAATGRPDFMDRGLDFASGVWAVAAVDTADGQPLAATLPVAAAQGAAGATLQLSASVTAGLLSQASPSAAATPAPSATVAANAGTQQIGPYWSATDLTHPGDLPAGEQVSGAPVASGGSLVVPLSENLRASAPAGDRIAFTAPFPGDVLAGETVSGAGIANGTTVSGYDPTAGTVTLSTPTVAAVAAGAELTFATNAPAIRIGDGQTVDLSGDGDHLLTHLAAGLAYEAGGKPVLVIDDSGDATLGGTLSVAGHLIASGPAPILSGCGSSPMLSATASDRHGTVTPGSGASGCTINFHAVYGSAPDVVLTGWGAGVDPFILSATASSVAVGFGAVGKFTYLVEQ